MSEEQIKFDIQNVNLHYGNFHALKDVNMKIRKNEITAFSGPSGCGKSTFLKTLNRMNDFVKDVNTFTKLHNANSVISSELY